MDRADFDPNADTGQKYRERSRFRRRIEGSTREVFFSDEILNQHSNFLYTHLLQLTRVDSSVLTGERHLHERALLKLLSDGKEGIDRKKVDAFVRTSRGLIITEMLMDLRLELTTFSLGLDLVAAWNRREQRSPGETSRTVNIGTIGREFNGFIGWMRQNLARVPDRRAALVGAIEGGTLGAGASAVATWLVQNYSEGLISSIMTWTEVQVAAFLGGIGGAVGGAFLGRRFLTNNGDIDFIACRENLRTIETLPQQEQDYIREVLGVYFEDYAVVDSRVVFRVLPHNRKTKDIFSIQDSVRKILDARQAFYRVIGTTRPDTRSVPFNPLRPNLEYFPRTDTVWSRRINEEYNKFLDEFRAAGFSDIDITTEMRLRAQIRAQQIVLNERVSSYLSGEGWMTDDETIGGWVDRAESVSVLKKLIERLKKQGEEQKQRLGKLRIALIGNSEQTSEGRLGGQVGRLQEMHDTLSQRTSLQEIEDETAKIIAVNSGNVRGMSPEVRTVGAFIGKIEESIEYYEGRIVEIRKKGDRERKEIRKIGYEEMSGKEKVDDIRTLDIREKAEIEEVQKILDDLRQKLDTVRKANLPLIQKQRQLEDTRRESTNHIKDRLVEDFNALIDLGLTPRNLAMMTEGELLFLINTIHTQDLSSGRVPPRGWPETQNYQQSNLDVVINAMVEGRRRQIMSDVIFASDDILMQLSGEFIDEHGALKEVTFSQRLLTRQNIDEINKRANDLYARTGGVKGWSIDQNEDRVKYIETAKRINDPDLRERAREEAIRSVILSLKKCAQELQDAEQNVDNGELLARAEAVLKTIETNEALYIEIRQGIRDENTRRKFVDRSSILDRQQDYPTTQEQEYRRAHTTVPRGYYEWLQLIFKYQNNENRGQAFLRAASLISPAELAGILRETPSLHIPHGTRLSLRTVLTILEQNLNAGLINERDVRPVIDHIINFARGRITGLIG